MSATKLSLDELIELEDKIYDIYDGTFEKILAHINTKGKIEEFLQLLDHAELVGKDEDLYSSFPTGNVVVLGDSQLRKEDIIAALKEVGLSKDRIELHLGYDLGGFNVETLKYSFKTSLILVGPVPHSMPGKAKYTSVLEMMEREQGYPPVKRLENNGAPKITKSNLKEELKKATLSGEIVL